MVKRKRTDVATEQQPVNLHCGIEQGDLARWGDLASSLAQELYGAQQQGPDVAAHKAHSFIQRGVIIPLLLLLQRSTEAVAMGAERLLSVLLDIARTSLFSEQISTVSSLAVLTDSTWEALLMQQLGSLSAPQRVNGSFQWPVEIIAYVPCCGNLLLDVDGCNHRALRTVVDIGSGCCDNKHGFTAKRIRQLHAGLWQGLTDGVSYSSLDADFCNGALLESWSDVTLAGAALLAIGRWEERCKGNPVECQQPSVLVLGMGAGLLPSFLCTHAPAVHVHVVESHAERLEIALKHFGLERKGADVYVTTARHTATAFDSERQRGRFRVFSEVPTNGPYVAILSPGPPARDDFEIDLPLSRLVNLLDPFGVLAVEAFGSSTANIVMERLHLLADKRSIVELVELELVETDCGQTSDDRPRVVLSGADESVTSLSSLDWYRFMHAPRGIFDSRSMPLTAAQHTDLIRKPAVLSDSDIEWLNRIADEAERAGVGREVRSEPATNTWDVLFLQTDGFLESRAPSLLDRLTILAQSVAQHQSWCDDDRPLSLRVAEFHQQRAPGIGIPDPFHYDMDSVVTLDIMLSKPGVDFKGGEFATFEDNGHLKMHAFDRGDAVIFASHKFHCVSPVIAGCRNVAVFEFWHGPTRRCPHRCRCLQPICPLDRYSGDRCSSDGELSGGNAVTPLPFRLASADVAISPDTCAAQRTKLFWHGNDYLPDYSFNIRPTRLDLGSTRKTDSF